jgi:glycosyltransferase involved in cell wall biosynthesis
MRKLLIVAWSSDGGGAANATKRIFEALEKHASRFGWEVHLRTIVGKKLGTNHVVGHPRVSEGYRYFRKYLWFLRRGPGHFLCRKPSYLGTYADIPSGLGKELQASYLNEGFELVNLHWIGNFTISLQEIRSLGVPIVWTLSDDWLFTGNKHYPSESSLRISNLLGDGWSRLLKALTVPRSLVIAKSSRVAGLAKNSLLRNRIKTVVLANPVDIEFWAPGTPKDSRTHGRQVVRMLFGYSGSAAGFRKGEDFVLPFVTAFAERARSLWGTVRVELLVFGDAVLSDDFHPGSSIFIQRFGSLGAEELRALYRTADFFLVFSRFDNTPNTLLEAMASGAVVVVREGGGADDLIHDEQTGFVWRASESMGDFVSRLISTSSDKTTISENARRLIGDRLGEVVWVQTFTRLIEEYLKPSAKI